MSDHCRQIYESAIDTGVWTTNKSTTRDIERNVLGGRGGSQTPLLRLCRELCTVVYALNRAITYLQSTYPWQEHLNGPDHGWCYLRR